LTACTRLITDSLAWLDEALKPIVAAARRAFLRHGVERTRMADVAREAGVVRQTLYDFVSGREQLIELALLDWCEDLKARPEQSVADAPADLEDALVEFLARAVEEFAALAKELGPQRTDELLAGPTAVQAIVAESLRPLLERAPCGGRPPPACSSTSMTRAARSSSAAPIACGSAPSGRARG
jgi:AcrR family transcriptional regulator